MRKRRKINIKIRKRNLNQSQRRGIAKSSAMPQAQVLQMKNQSDLQKNKLPKCQAQN